MSSFFRGQDVLSTKDIPRGAYDSLFAETDGLRKEMGTNQILKICNGLLLTTVFLEPSTRTRLSFQFAMTKLGGKVIDFGPSEAASIAKGETFEDTMKMVDGYSPDTIVVRSRAVGSAATASSICRAPIINAGDGSNEHPTQAMLDMYTIRTIRGSIDGVKIGLMGDLAHSRTTSSLSYALDKYDGVEIYFIAPDELQAKPEVLDSIHRSHFVKVKNYESAVEKLDFLYVTRLQKERFANQEEYNSLKGSYQLSRSSITSHAKFPFIMHPLPRVDELDSDVDALPQAKYFEQALNGMFVRAALLKAVMGR